MYLWMKVSEDEYELPVAVEDTSVKLAQKMGVSAEWVRASARNDRYYKKIKIEDNEDDM